MSDVVEKERQAWQSFLQKKRRIFLYGAGTYGKLYFEVLSKLGIEVAGFLVSSSVHAETYLGLPVLSAENYQRQEGDGVIAAFRNASFEQLAIQVLQKEDCLFLSQETFEWLRMNVVLFPHLAELAKTPCLPLPAGKLDWKAILVIRMDVIGDFLLTIPFLRELRRNYLAARITLVVRENLKEMAARCPYVDEVKGYPVESRSQSSKTQRDSWEEDVAEAKAFLEGQLPNASYDVAFLPRRLFLGLGGVSVTEFILAVLSGATYRIGRMDQFDDFMYSNMYPKLQSVMSKIVLMKEPKHEVEYLLDMLRACGCKIADEKMEYPLLPADVSSARRAISWEKGWTYVACGIVGREPYRSWAPENYRALIQSFANQRVKFVLLGGGNAVEAAEIIGAGENVIDLTGKTTLPQVAAVISQTNLYVGSDTGLLHFASATGVPIVELSVWLRGGDPTNDSAPQRIGPWDVPSRVLIPEPGLDGCYGRCSKPYAHCINTITVEEVTQAMQALLSTHDVLASQIGNMEKIYEAND